MLSELINTSGWTHEQWLAACILTFAILSVIVVLHRMMKLFRMTKKPSYKPNLRPLRRRRFSAKAESVDQDEQALSPHYSPIRISSSVRRLRFA